MQRTRNLIIALPALVVLISCEHKVSTETTVYPDGSLDKTFVLETKDSANNLFGVNESSGWARSVHPTGSANDSAKDRTWKVSFQKHFVSAEEANKELAVPNDTLLRVTSTLDKRFRWFYTYMRYAETFHAVNSMRLKPDDYLVPEDYAFIERLPAEGQAISKADSFYLKKLHDRIWDDYGLRAYFEEYLALGVDLLQDQPDAKQWTDTLNQHKESIYQLLQTTQDIEEDFLLHTMDSLGIAVTEPMKGTYARMSKTLDARVNFVSNASEGKYSMRINMPWQVVASNADSVAGNSLFWSPPSIKFLLKDYTIYGESRKLNGWPIAISVLLIMTTLYLWWRRNG